MEESSSDPQRKMPSKTFVGMLYLPLTIPAFIPLWMAREQEDPIILAIMYGTAVALLIGNGLLLVMLYRWFEARMSDD